VPALVALVDAGLCHRFVNAAYRQWYGIDPQGLIGRPLAELWDAPTLERLQPALQRALAGERASVEHALRIGGRERFVEISCLPQADAAGADGGCVVVVYDVTARKQLELQLAREAHFDALTGLPNRRHLMEQLSRAMLRTQRQGQPLALLFLDLDGFKGVNDRHGHDAGDRLLQAVAQRLQRGVRRTDTVARLAGDEFVVLLEGLSSVEDAAPVIDTIRDALTQPVELPGGVTVQVGASVGSAIYAGEPDVGAEQLLSRSDAAMYEAKRGRLRAREAAAVPRTA
jgi:diguanylate cyclase (GGDEF)-like protein/PAS domain S-box-containing protein